MPGRNKLRPVLFGISRESVMRLDKKTKSVIKTWPLTTVQSYASTPSSFSLVRRGVRGKKEEAGEGERRRRGKEKGGMEEGVVSDGRKEGRKGEGSM